MPKATIEGLEPQKFELKTLPEGYVSLQRMPYGMWLKRQEMALKLEIQATKGKDTQGEMAMANKDVTVYEFKNTIIDHNLENAGGEKLDFRNPATLEILDPRVGNEIGDLIAKLHEPISEDNQGN